MYKRYQDGQHLDKVSEWNEARRYKSKSLVVDQINIKWFINVKINFALHSDYVLIQSKTKNFEVN